MILVNIHNNCHIATSICQFLDLMFPELWAPFEIIGLFLGFPDSSVDKESAWNAGDPGSIPESGRSPGERIGNPLLCSWASLVAQLVKNPPAMWETWVRPPCWKDALEKGKATYSSILAWRIPWTVHGLTESDITERLSLSLSTLTVLNPWASHFPGLTQPHWSLISRLLCRTLCLTLTSQYCRALRDFSGPLFHPDLFIWQSSLDTYLFNHLYIEDSKYLPLSQTSLSNCRLLCLTSFSISTLGAENISNSVCLKFYVLVLPYHPYPHLAIIKLSQFHWMTITYFPLLRPKILKSLLNSLFFLYRVPLTYRETRPCCLHAFWIYLSPPPQLLS